MFVVPKLLPREGALSSNGYLCTSAYGASAIKILLVCLFNVHCSCASADGLLENRHSHIGHWLHWLKMSSDGPDFIFVCLPKLFLQEESPSPVVGFASKKPAICF